jgi:hypothetical protein
LLCLLLAVGLVFGMSPAPASAAGPCGGGPPIANGQLWSRDLTFLGVNCRWDFQAGTYITRAYAQEMVNGTVWGASQAWCKGQPPVWSNWVGVKTSTGNTYGSAVVGVLNWNTWLRAANVPNFTTAIASCYDNSWIQGDGYNVI